MSNAENGANQLNALFAEGNEHDSEQVTTVTKMGIGRTAFWTAFWSTGAIVAAGAVGYATSFYPGFLAAGVDVRGETTAGVSDGGKSEIIELSLDIPPTTIATAKTSNEGHPLEVGLNQEVAVNIFSFIDFKIPLGTDSIKREAIVTEKVQLDATKVDVSIDPENGEFIYTVPNASLSADVSIESGNARNVDGTDSLITSFNDAIGGSQVKTFDGFMKSLNVNTDTRNLPYIKDLVKQNRDTANVLMDYADFKIEASVGEKCTPLFEEIPGFTDGIKDNIRTVMRGQLLSDGAPKVVKDALGQIPAESVADAQEKLSEMADNAEVILPDELKIAMDTDAAEKLKQLDKIDGFTSVADKKPMKCGVGELVTATREQDNG